MVLARYAATCPRCHEPVVADVHQIELRRVGWTHIDCRHPTATRSPYGRIERSPTRQGTQS